MTFFNNTNRSDDNQSDDNWSYSYIIDITVVLNTFLSKLNTIMKNILNVLCVHTAINFTILAVGYGIQSNNMDVNFCTIAQVLERATCVKATFSQKIKSI